MVTPTSFIKNFFKIFSGNWTRFFIIVGLTFISMAIVSGIGVLSPQMNSAIRDVEHIRTPEQLEFSRYISDAIGKLSFIFPMFFITITVLVVYMTAVRFVESERAQIGCLKTLGYSRAHIVAKYVFFVGVGCLLGCLLGVVGGYFGIAPVLYAAINDGHNLPVNRAVFPVFGVVAAAVMVFFVVGVTFLTAFLTARESPAVLFRGRAPKKGGRIIFEKIPLWRFLKYKYKSTFRNIFRYKVRFFMTILSMVFCTILIFCGMALFFTIEKTDPEFVTTMRPVSSVLCLAAVFVSAMVLYNITNINIEERKREIATLMVLGYTNFEVIGYIFREIFVLTCLGVAVGLPLGYGGMAGLFDYLKFGGIRYLDWYVWVISGVLSFASLGLANVLLFRKIQKTDMNGALKVME